MKFIITQDKENDLVPSLLKEYEVTLNRIEGFETRAIQVAGAMLGALGVIVGYFISKQTNIPDGMLWLLLTFISLVCLYIVFLYYLIAISTWNARIIAYRVNNILGEKVLINYDRGSPGPTFLSSLRGHQKSRIVYITLPIIGAVFCFSLIIAATVIIDSRSHLEGSLFMLTFISLLLFLAFLGSGPLVDVPRFYNKFFREFPRGEPIPSSIEYDKLAMYKNSATENTFLALIVPRPADVSRKIPFFIYGFVTALLLTGLQNKNLLAATNFLFTMGTQPWQNFSVVPGWAIFAIGVVCLIVEEVLLQQAKLLWDDIRDIERDKKLSLNKDRALAKGLISRDAAILNMIIRLVLAFLLGYWLGGVPLLLVFSAIIVHQVGYELWAKPRGYTHPVQLIIWLSFNIALRFLAGVVVVAGFKGSLLPFILLFVSFYFCSFGGMAAHWKMEATHYGKDIRPQAEYYRSKKGELWQHVGLIAAILVAALVFSMLYLPLPCNIGFPFLSGEYILPCDSAYINVGWGLDIILTILLIAASIAVSWILIFLLQHIAIGNWIAKRIRKYKRALLISLQILMGLLLVTILSNLFVSAIEPYNTFILLFTFFVINVFYFVVFEGLEYDEYIKFDLFSGIKNILLGIYRYVFNVN